MSKLYPQLPCQFAIQYIQHEKNDQKIVGASRPKVQDKGCRDKEIHCLSIPKLQDS